MAEHDIHLSAGEVLRDQYKIIRHIGSGGMAVVYLACELHDESKLWAVKIADTEKKMARRLSAEGKVLSRLHHKNLPQIADFFIPTIDAMCIWSRSILKESHCFSYSKSKTSHSQSNL